MDPKYTYTTRVDNGDGMDMHTLKFGETTCVVIIRSDGVIVHRGQSYWSRYATGRTLSGMKGAAAKLAKRYAYHLAKTGECFYDQEQRKRREAKAAKDRARKQREIYAKHGEQAYYSLRRMVIAAEAANVRLSETPAAEALLSTIRDELAGVP